MLKTTRVPDPATSRALREIKDSLPTSRLFADAVKVSVKFVAGSTVRVAHSLRRRPEGCWVAKFTSDPGANFRFYDDGSDKPDQDRFLYLRAEGGSPTAVLFVV